MRKIIITALLCLPMAAMAKTSYHAQVNHFALKQGQEWSWGQVAKTPNIKWENKTPKNYGNSKYSMGGSMGEWGGLSVTGTKSKPLIIHFNSSQTYSRSENGADVYTLHQLFKKTELTKLKSNCSVDENSGRMSVGEYQHFYRWQKKGYQPLYLGVRRFQSGTFNGGIIMNYIIVKDFDLFNDESIYDLERYDANGDETICRIL